MTATTIEPNDICNVPSNDTQATSHQETRLYDQSTTISAENTTCKVMPQIETGIVHPLGQEEVLPSDTFSVPLADTQYPAPSLELPTKVEQQNAQISIVVDSQTLPEMNTQNESQQLTQAPHINPNGNFSDHIGDYLVGETIGKGTFGKVKLGHHLLTGEKVAIKILEKCRIVEAADVERVTREIKILKLNRHLNVIQLYEVVDSPERIYLIMEHADSGEMFEYIVKNHRIREPLVVSLFQQIVDGLDYLHSNEVTHRDLKPENLLLQSSNSKTGLLVKIVDFGLSNTHDGGRLLRTACGSPCYAAPEMIEGKLYKGPLADVWSLGVVLFAMVCGYLPFEDNNTSQLYKKILSADYKLPSFLSQGAQDLIMRILETNPLKRYTIEDIRQHPWYKSYNSSLPRMVLDRNDSVLQSKLLAQLEALGFDVESVYQALQLKLYNNLTASYYILFNKHLRVAKNYDLFNISLQQGKTDEVSNPEPYTQLLSSWDVQTSAKSTTTTNHGGVRANYIAKGRHPEMSQQDSQDNRHSSIIRARRRSQPATSIVPGSGICATRYTSYNHHRPSSFSLERQRPRSTQNQTPNYHLPNSNRSGRTLALLPSTPHQPAQVTMVHPAHDQMYNKNNVTTPVPPAQPKLTNSSRGLYSSTKQGIMENSNSRRNPHAPIPCRAPSSNGMIVLSPLSRQASENRTRTPRSARRISQSPRVTNSRPQTPLYPTNSIGAVSHGNPPTVYTSKEDDTRKPQQTPSPVPTAPSHPRLSNFYTQQPTLPSH